MARSEAKEAAEKPAEPCAWSESSWLRLVCSTGGGKCLAYVAGVALDLLRARHRARVGVV